MLTAAAMFLLLVWTPGSVAYECPDFAGRDWDFVGHLVAATFPGPPDYESVTSGDKPVRRWYLQLPYAACFSEYAHQTLFQLSLEPDEFKKYQQFLGKQIRVKGTLEEGVPGLHTTSLVMKSPASRNLGLMGHDGCSVASVHCNNSCYCALRHFLFRIQVDLARHHVLVQERYS